jgi:choline dehydrogenase-like flavoprotein
MQKYFRKFQRHHSPPKEAMEILGMEVLNEDTLAMSGPISSSYPKAPDVIQKAWIDTWKRLGKQLNGDPLSGNSVGGYTSASSVNPEKGERAHSGVGYYAPVAHRENLHVVTGAMIDKIEFDTADQDNVVVTGVSFKHAGITYTARAKKEVIVSTGTIASPAILERSGIGSKDLCDKLGIRNVVDNPGVGENFQDHMMAGISYEVKDGVPTGDVMRDPAVITKVMEQYQTSRSGPLADTGGLFAYTPLSGFIDPPVSQQEIEALLDKHIPKSSTSSDSFQAQHEAFVRSILTNPNEASSSLCFICVQFDGTHAHTPNDVFSIHKPENYIAMLPQLAHPLSLGHVHITSTEPDTHPTIQPNFCGHPLDAEIMGRHMLQVETLAKTAPLSDLLKPGGKRLPEGHDALTLENAIELVRASGMSNYHPSGTCAMKPREMGGVIDSRLKVYGTKNLRVCDASIFPIMVRGNIQSTVYAVAEKGADILKEDLGVMQ